MEKSLKVASIRYRRFRQLSLTTWMFFGILAIAIAATGYADFLRAIAQRESSMNPAANNHGYMGLFQMGTLAMTDAGYYQSKGTALNSWGGTFTGKNGVTSISQFVSNPDMQIHAITDYYVKLQSYISYFGLTSYIGKTLNGVPITASGLIAGAHLVGIGSLKLYLESGGTVVPRDGNNVPVTSYISTFGGYAISSIAPSYAAVLAATPTGSVPITPTIPVPGGGASSSSPVFAAPPSFSNPDAAFAAYSGYSMAEVAEVFRLLLGAVLFLWVAYIFVGAYQGHVSGSRIRAQLGRWEIRALILLSLFLAILR